MSILATKSDLQEERTYLQGMAFHSEASTHVNAAVRQERSLQFTPVASGGRRPGVLGAAGARSISGEHTRVISRERWSCRVGV
jgi:hypothetical protein